MVVVFLLIAAVVAVLDQAIKYFVVCDLKPVHSVEAIPHLLDLVYVENRGVAFGMFDNMRWIFVALTSVVIVVFVFMLIKYGKNSKLLSISCALIIGGGIGNLIDRVYLGYVVDYLRLSFFPPVCNFADYCITAGTVCLVVYLLFFSDFINKKDKAEVKR